MIHYLRFQLRFLGLSIAAGIGPDFIKTSHYEEKALINSILPNNGFSGKTHTAFTTMVGFDVNRKNSLGTAPLSCGYRFFYLGQGEFSKQSSQIINQLKSSNEFANAVMCGLTL